MNTGNDMLISTGGALKALGEGKVGGYGVYFTSELQPDLDGEFFTKETNFELEDRTTLPLYFGHATDPVMKKQKLGKATFKQDEQGIWFDVQLNLRDRWLKKIYELAQQGKLSFSSGAIGHLVEKVQKAGAVWLKTWPIGEMSFTPCPAAPYGTEVMALKFYREPSLKEMVRRSTLSDVELLREEGERIRERALATLEGTPSPDRWANYQVMRGANNSEGRVARVDWIKMRDEAKIELKKVAELLKEADALVKDQKAEVRNDALACWRYEAVKNGHLLYGRR